MRVYILELKINDNEFKSQIRYSNAEIYKEYLIKYIAFKNVKKKDLKISRLGLRSLSQNL